jgi:alanine racemase
MNMMTVDVTNLESVKKDDEVVLIGSQNEISISIASLVIIVTN